MQKFVERSRYSLLLRRESTAMNNATPPVWTKTSESQGKRRGIKIVVLCKFKYNLGCIAQATQHYSPNSAYCGKREVKRRGYVTLT